jgi:acetyltransferase EpsM
MILFGAGGHAKVVLDAALVAGLEVEMVLDDDPPGAELFGIPVRQRNDVAPEWLARQNFLVAIGDDGIRGRLFEELKAQGGTPVNIIHPKAWISPRAETGQGVFAAALAVVNPGTRIGDNCILNTACSVDHDCHIGAHVHLCPGVHLAGQVQVGAYTMIGTGASVLPGVRIGRRCVVGAGAVVTKEVPDGRVVAGVPAREIKTARTKAS